MRVKSKKISGELYKHLYQTERGCVYRNGMNENLFMMDFGNMFLSLSKVNFITFKDFITTIKLTEIHKLIVQPSNKIIIQPMKSMGFYAFTESQFIELQELILKSFDLIEIEDEINLLLNAS
tara:strand:- start:1755 stop:2120 length:366 start_codon:yes stop_codon:yes gene_type:complete